MLYPEDEGTMVLCKIRNYFPSNKASHTRRLKSAATCLQEPHICCYAIQILISTYAFE